MEELKAQFNKTDAYLAGSSKAAETFDNTILEKPKMFIPKDYGRLKLTYESSSNAVRGIGFKKTTENINSTEFENKEIYSMKELIDTNPENMETFSYDENVMKAQLALVKKKEWQDILFGDVDWFMKIDITSGLKKIFKKER